MQHGPQIPRETRLAATDRDGGFFDATEPGDSHSIWPWGAILFWPNLGFLVGL